MNTHFEILETLALKDGRWQNWPLHWARLQITAHHFRYPLMQMQLESDMAQLAQKHAEGHWRVRLALSVTGAVQFTVAQLLPSAEPVKRFTPGRSASLGRSLVGTASMAWAGLAAPSRAAAASNREQNVEVKLGMGPRRMDGSAAARLSPP